MKKIVSIFMLMLLCSGALSWSAAVAVEEKTRDRADLIPYLQKRQQVRDILKSSDFLPKDFLEEEINPYLGGTILKHWDYEVDSMFLYSLSKNLLLEFWGEDVSRRLFGEDINTRSFQEIVDFVGLGNREYMRGHLFDHFYGFSVLPCGVIISSGGDIYLLDNESMNEYQGAVILESYDAKINCLLVLPNEKIVSGLTDGTVRILDIGNSENNKSFLLEDGDITCLSALSNTKIAVASSGFSGDKIVMLDIEEPTKSKTFFISDKITCLSALSDKKIAVGFGYKKIKIFNLETSAFEELAESSSSIAGLVVLPDKRIVSWGKNGVIQIWSVETGLCQKSFKDKEDILNLSLLSNGLIVSLSVSGEFTIWDLDSDKKAQEKIKKMATKYLVLLQQAIVKLPADRQAHWLKELCLLDVTNARLVENFIGKVSADRYLNKIKNKVVFDDIDVVDIDIENIDDLDF